MSLIEVKNITKYYGKSMALENVNLAIDENKIYGLLGRNGAGKTTLLNLMTNRSFPTEGDVQINGETVFENDKVLNSIFYVTEKNLYPEALKIKEIFQWTGEFYKDFDLSYANELASSFQLDVRKKVKELSTGYKSIFKAILAFASNADILIFDEPVLGLDANHRELFYRKLLENFINHPKTIIISTHLIEEVSDIIEEVIIIKDGRIVLNKSVEDLLSSAYKVCGERSNVDKYVENKKYIGVEKIDQFKSVTILENINEKNNDLASRLNLEFNKVELQKLFIELTSL